VATRLRTALFVPGDRPERIVKAVGHSPDAVVVDLEDAVADAAKERARTVAVERLSTLRAEGVRMMVRVNAIDTDWFIDDVLALAPVLEGISAVLLPKSRCPGDVEVLDRLLTNVEKQSDRTGRTAILPIVETSDGVLEARSVAESSSRVETLLFGVADLSTELQIEATADGEELLHARSHVVLAAAAARRQRPLDGPHLRLDDPDGLRRSVALARRLGFGGKAVIHPAQLAPVLEEFSPSESELRWARIVDRAFTEAERVGRASIRLADGTFVDYPVARRARAILAETAPPGGDR
jgi:citrate lyase subunit beta / citryl-CoA lyase